MRKFRPVIPDTTIKTMRLVRSFDQGFWTLTFPALGAATWSNANRIIAEYRARDVDSNFALIKPYPTFACPVTVRDRGVRYVISPTQPQTYALRYTGQTLSTGAIFEFWSFTGQTTATLNQVVAQISLREQLLDNPDAPTNVDATGYVLEYAPYPVYYPIVSP